MAAPNVEADDLTVEQFIYLHERQLTLCGLPRIHWEPLYAKVKNEVFDASDDFMLMRVEYADSDERGWKVVVTAEEGVLQNESYNVYLIDHAWTYDSSVARKMLQASAGLLDRMCDLMDIGAPAASGGDTSGGDASGGDASGGDASGGDADERISCVLEKMWLFNQTYSVAGTELGSAESLPVWYVMDEFGSRIQHSDTPSVKLVPFMYSPTQTCYSIFWPLTDLHKDDEVTRDFAPHIPASEEMSRLAHLLPWSPCDFTEIDETPTEPDDSYFKISRFDGADWNAVRTPVLPDSPLLVWTTDPFVAECLTSDKFKLTDNRDEAHVIWQNENIRDFQELSNRDTLLNQFPYECLVTTKDLLSTVSRRAAPAGKLSPRWLPITFNLNTELPEFIAYFQKRAHSGEDNHWIAKPWNLGRGLGHVITSNIDCLVRLPESGPFIACKYLDNAVLVNRPDGLDKVKFDYRYMVLLKSIKPLRLSCSKIFFLKFANKPFSMDNFSDYGKHFTVHNYSSPDQLLNINCEDFVPMWDQQYPDHPWSTIEADTMQCLLELFEAATSRDPPYGIPNYPQSRAHYGVDIMLKWDTDSQGRRTMVPQILEANFISDCKRACQYYPDYFNRIFTSLFLDDKKAEQESDIVIV